MLQLVCFFIFVCFLGRSSQHPLSSCPLEFQPISARGYPDVVESHPSQQANDLLQCVQNEELGVIIQPRSIDFGSGPICIATLQTVSVTGTKVKSVNVDAGWNFHATMLPEKLEEAPDGSPKHSIEVMFLPRALGRVAGTVLIETTLGTFLYPVSGVGIENPYGFRPVLKYGVAVGKTALKDIEIFNPHSQVLKVTSVVGSENALLLTLPSGSQTIEQWNLRPKQKKTIASLAFKAQTPGQFRAFVHINTNFDNLIMHVEYLVSPSSSANLLWDEVHFGTLTDPSQAQKRSLSLTNVGPSPIRVKEVSLSTPHPALEIEGRPRALQPNETATVATVAFRATSEGIFTGQFIVRTNDTSASSSQTRVPYYARVIHGSLEYSSNVSLYMGPDCILPVERALMLRNAFSVPILLRSATIQNDHFELVGFTPGTVIHPNCTELALIIKFKPNSTTSVSTAAILFDTNITAVPVPVSCFHGNLFFSPAMPARILTATAAPNASNPPLAAAPSASASVAKEDGTTAAQPGVSIRDAIEFGIISVKEAKQYKFNLTNPNPVPVKILGMHCDLPSFRIWYEGTEKGTIEPGHSQTLVMEVIASEEEDRLELLEVQTSHQTWRAAVHYTAVAGSLATPSPIRLEGATYRRPVRHPLVVTSTFRRAVQVVSATTTDPRFAVELVRSEVRPGEESEIGFVTFDPLATSVHDFMVSSAHSTQNESSLKNLLGAEEIEEHKMIYERAEQLQREGRISATLELVTNMLVRYTVDLLGTVKLPHVVSTSALTFKLVHVGTHATLEVPITNPSDVPIFTELCPGADFGPSTDSLKGIRKSNGRHLGDRGLSSDSHDAFMIPSGATTFIILKPHESGTLGPIRYWPTSLGPDHAVFFVRNNLTAIQAVDVYGEGGQGKLVAKAGAAQIEQLHLYVQRSQLQRLMNRSSASGVMLSKTFSLANVGNAHLHVRSMRISGWGTHQVKLEPCEGFPLRPGQATEILMQFHPDFTISLLRHQLVVETDPAGGLILPIELSLPHYALSDLYESTRCGPTNVLFFLAAVTTIVLGVVSFLMLYRDFDRASIKLLLAHESQIQGAAPPPAVEEEDDPGALSTAPPMLRAPSPSPPAHLNTSPEKPTGLGDRPTGAKQSSVMAATEHSDKIVVVTMPPQGSDADGLKALPDADPLQEYGQSSEQLHRLSGDSMEQDRSANDDADVPSDTLATDHGEKDRRAKERRRKERERRAKREKRGHGVLETPGDKPVVVAASQSAGLHAVEEKSPRTEAAVIPVADSNQAAVRLAGVAHDTGGASPEADEEERNAEEAEQEVVEGMAAAAVDLDEMEPEATTADVEDVKFAEAEEMKVEEADDYGLAAPAEALDASSAEKDESASTRPETPVQCLTGVETEARDCCQPVSWPSTAEDDNGPGVSSERSEDTVPEAALPSPCLSSEDPAIDEIEEQGGQSGLPAYRQLHGVLRHLQSEGPCLAPGGFPYPPTTNGFQLGHEFPGSLASPVSPPRFSLFTPHSLLDPFGAVTSPPSFFPRISDPVPEVSPYALDNFHDDPTSVLIEDDKPFSNPFEFLTFNAERPTTYTLFSSSPFALMQQPLEGSADAADLLRNIHGLEGSWNSL